MSNENSDNFTLSRNLRKCEQNKIENKNAHTKLGSPSIIKRFITSMKREGETTHHSLLQRTVIYFMFVQYIDGISFIEMAVNVTVHCHGGPILFYQWTHS